MPKTTTNLQFNLFEETDVVDFELINQNFEKIDNTKLWIGSDKTASTYSIGEVNGTASWYYKEMSDRHVEMYTKIDLDTLKCSNGSGVPYYSDTVTLNLPVPLDSVHDVQMHLNSSTVGWIIDETGANMSSFVKFKVASFNHEPSVIYKQIFVSIKGIKTVNSAWPTIA